MWLGWRSADSLSPSFNLFHQTGHRLESAKRLGFPPTRPRTSLPILFTAFIKVPAVGFGGPSGSTPAVVPVFPLPSLCLLSLLRSSLSANGCGPISSLSPPDYSAPASRSVVKTHLQERMDNPDFRSHCRPEEVHP